ncbi:hypothetical protein FB567DRAFT_543675 [Paraphoma chrysanthemicola]|uniref:Uncharacterized protein n=1 Tax=Paraphoma chrysanthemicola TaxID=798071 RepID=A0A8K0RFU8_9PLEO|nr:hypothetical protein FB567DRAFT_543675 [Paraphoma chrysanthemicola]
MAHPNTRIGPRAQPERLRDDVRQAIEGIRMNTTFTAFGSLFPAALIDIGLVVKGLGSVEIPLAPSDARALVELSQDSHRSGDQASLRGPILWGFQNVDACDVTLAPAWTDLLEETVNKVKQAFDWPTNAKVEPQLIEFIVQTWGSEIVFPSFGFAEDSAHLATLVIFLPSRHDGGRIEISRAGAVMDFNTAQQSESEFQFLAIRHDATVAPTTITAGARVGLLYRLCSKVDDLKTEAGPCHQDTSLGLDDGLSEQSDESSAYHYPEEYMKQDRIVVAKPWTLRQPFRSDSPEMVILREILSSWLNTASDSQYPSMLVYTLEGDYCLDLLSCPDFEGDDRERLHALHNLTADLEFSLYYTILSQRVTSANDIVDTQRLLHSDKMVDACAHEMMLRLCDGPVDDHVNVNVLQSGHSIPFSLSRSEIIYDTSRRFTFSATSSRRSQRTDNEKLPDVHTDFLYLPALLIVPAVSNEELATRTWATMLHSGVEEPMHSWLDYLLSQGKKQGDWLDEEMRPFSRKFLDLVPDAVRLEKGRTIRHADSWSRALDLIARIGMELRSDDIFRKAMTMRNHIDKIFNVPVIERFEKSRALEKLVEYSQWNDLNWWISLQLSLHHILDVCNHIHGKLLAYVEELKKPKPAKANELVSRRPRRPLTQVEVDAWRQSRVQDALLEIEHARSGDALRLCKLSIDWKDDMLRGCAQSFLASRLTDADFIISDLRASSAKISLWGFPEDIMNRYIMDFISPAIKAGPVVYARPQKFPLPQSHERPLSIVCSGHTLGRDFPRLLVSLAKLFTGTVADTMTFLKLVSTSPYWTTRSVLKEIGTHIVQPALERSSIAEVELVQRDVNTVDIADLVTVLRVLHDPQIKLSLEARLLRFIALIVTSKHLKPDDLKNELTDDRYRILRMTCDRYWSEQSRVGLPLQ